MNKEKLIAAIAEIINYDRDLVVVRDKTTGLEYTFRNGIGESVEIEITRI